jgi:uroporphyrinogen-III synthase
VVCGAGVGATSARALQRAGFRRVLTPAAGAGQTSEGLLAHPELAEGGGRGVLLIAAPGGREVLEQQLRARGFRVRRMEVYTRSAPRLDRRHFQLLEQAQPPLGLLLSSAQALDNLLAALPAALHERLKGAIVAAASPRLAEHAHACGFANVRTGSGPSTQALLETLAQMD